MPKVEFDIETPVAPERVRAALLDFSPRRPDIWPGIAPGLYEVYTVGDTSADIKEGTKSPAGSIWAKEHYDWSDPETVRWTVRESNFCAPDSYVAATIRPRASGGSAIHIEWNRTPTSFAGRVATWMIQMSKGGPVASSFKKGLAKLDQSTATTGATP